MNTSIPPESPKNRRRATIALAVKKPKSAAGPCPTEEELAAFIDNRLDDQARSDMLRHLASCQDCYAHWLDVARITDQAEQADQTDQGKRSDLADHVKPIRKFQNWAPLSAAIAAGFVLLFWVMSPFSPDPNLPGLIATSYRNLAESTDSSKPVNQPLPWEQPTAAYGLAGTKDSTPSLAFGAGLWQGRALLANQDSSMPAELSPPPESGASWDKTEWNPYFDLGRWVILAREAATRESPLPRAFWGQLHESSLLLSTSLETRKSLDSEAQQALEYLADISSPLEEFDKQQPTARQKNRLGNSTRQLLAQLAPSVTK